MTVRYALKRRDIWETYWFTWRNGWKLKAAQAIIATCVFFSVRSLLVRGDLSPAGQMTMAAVAALLSILWLPVYPLLRYKSQQRMLTIAPEGITTSIGELSGEVPWEAIDRVEVRNQRLYVVGKSGNAFMVPSAAFTSPEEQERFAAQAVSWWRAQSAA